MNVLLHRLCLSVERITPSVWPGARPAVTSQRLTGEQILLIIDKYEIHPLSFRPLFVGPAGRQIHLWARRALPMQEKAAAEFLVLDICDISI